MLNYLTLSKDHFQRLFQVFLSKKNKQNIDTLALTCPALIGQIDFLRYQH